MNIKTTISTLSLIGLLGVGLPVQGMDLVQVTSNTREEMAPQMSGNYLVWQGSAEGTDQYPSYKNWEVYLYNISNEETTRLSNHPFDDTAPQTDGNYVTWLRAPGGLLYYDIAMGTTTEITQPGAAYVKSSPQIANGRITFSAKGFLGYDEVYVHDIASGVTTNISAQVDPGNQMDDIGPMINDNMVAWGQLDYLGTDDPEDDVETMMIYDFSSGIAAEAPEDFISLGRVQTGVSVAVTSTHDGNDREIVIRRGGASLQVTDNSTNDSSPSSSGLNFAWVSGSRETAEIMLAKESDSDGDGVTDSFDNAVNTPNTNQLDTDVDGVGDVIDNCVEVANADQLDSDGDGIGDACEVAEPEFEISFDVTDDWGSGYCADVIITNISDEAKPHPYGVHFVLPTDVPIHNWWTGSTGEFRVEETQDGQYVTVIYPRWQDYVDAGESENRFGFCVRVPSTVMPVSPTFYVPDFSNIVVSMDPPHSTWSTGYCARISLTNNGTERSVHPDYISYTMPTMTEFTSYWQNEEGEGGQMTRDGETVSYRYPYWVYHIEPGETVTTSGFCTDGLDQPSNFVIVK